MDPRHQNTTEQPDEKTNQKSKNSRSFFRSYLDRLLEPAVIRNVSVCSADQCSAIPPPEASLHAQPVSGVVLPSELSQAMITAATKGFLYNFLCSLDEEFLTAYLKQKNYTREQIYWLNKAIKALTLICFGAAYGKTLASPLLTCLIAAYCGIQENYAGYMTSAFLLGVDLLTSDSSTHAASLASFGVSIVAGALGYAAGKAVYDRRNTLTSFSFLAERKTEPEETVLQMEELDEVQVPAPSL